VPTVPKSKLPLVDGDQSIDGVLTAWPVAAASSSVTAAAAATRVIRVIPRIAPPSDE
jgi:hypothetical protein